MDYTWFAVGAAVFVLLTVLVIVFLGNKMKEPKDEQEYKAAEEPKEEKNLDREDYKIGIDPYENDDSNILSKARAEYPMNKEEVDPRIEMIKGDKSIPKKRSRPAKRNSPRAKKK